MKSIFLAAFQLQVSLVAAFNLIEVENDFPMPAATTFVCEKNPKLIKRHHFGLLRPSNPLILATPGPWGVPYLKGSNCDIKLMVPRKKDVFLFFEKIDLGNQTYGSDDDNLKIILGREKFKIAGPNLEKKILRFEATNKKKILFLKFSPDRNSEVGSGYRIWIFSNYFPHNPPPQNEVCCCQNGDCSLGQCSCYAGWSITNSCCCRDQSLTLAMEEKLGGVKLANKLVQVFLESTELNLVSDLQGKLKIDGCSPQLMNNSIDSGFVQILGYCKTSFVGNFTQEGSETTIQLKKTADIMLTILNGVTLTPINGLVLSINGEILQTNIIGEVSTQKCVSDSIEIKVEVPKEFCFTESIKFIAAEGANMITVELKPIKDSGNLLECLSGPDLITPEDLQGQTLSEIANRMAMKVEAPGKPKGNPFKKINGPQSMFSKIGIVGAGPAGIHMAYSLKLLGYNDVTILEKNNRLGGKSQTMRVRSTPQSLTTVFFSDGFGYSNTMTPLFRKFGFLTPNSYTFSSTFESIVWTTNDKRGESYTRAESSLRWLLSYFKSSNVQEVTQLFIKDIAKYINLHWKLFGKYEFTLMRRPDDSILQQLSGTFLDFLNKNDLASLADTARTILSIPGYGTLETIPTISALIWIRPDTLLALLRGDRLYHFKERTFTELFELMAKEQNLTFKYNFEVTGIDRINLDGLKYELSNQFGQKEQFDFLIWAGLPSTLGRLTGPKSITQEHLQRVLDSSKHHTASVSVVEVKSMVKRAKSQGFAKQINSPTFDNSVTLDWDTWAASIRVTPANYSTRNFVYNDSSSAASQLTFTVLQYCFCYPTIYETQQKLIEHYEGGFDGDNLEILSTFAYDYFPRWSVEDVAKGYHWDLYDNQGIDNLWIIGGGAVFDSTANVVGYNQLLLQSFM